MVEKKERDSVRRSAIFDIILIFPLSEATAVTQFTTLILMIVAMSCCGKI